MSVKAGCPEKNDITEKILTVEIIMLFQTQVTPFINTPHHLSLIAYGAF
jgi:hypothetical protein